MDFSYIGSGEIDFHGCPEVIVDYVFKIKYAIGSKVYDLISANAGRLEAVIVRKAWYVCDPRTRQNKVIYKDGDNWLHNESDLCSHSEAIDAADVYYNNKLNDVNKALAQFNC